MQSSEIERFLIGLTLSGKSFWGHSTCICFAYFNLMFHVNRNSAQLLDVAIRRSTSKTLLRCVVSLRLESFTQMSYEYVEPISEPDVIGCRYRAPT